MNIKKIFSQRNLFIIGVIICIILIVTSHYLSTQEKKITTIPVVPTPTTQPSIGTNPVEETQEWNAAFNKAISDYEKSRNKAADDFLSQIRMNSPVDVSGNTIEYDYRNATYTITLISPYPENKNKVLSWLNKNSVDSNTIKTLRIEWINKE